MAWCGDVIWIPADEGWLEPASVIDLASRRLLGSSMSTITAPGRSWVPWIDRHHWQTRAQARAAVFAWTAWRNRFRLHSTRGYLPPLEWEHQHATISPPSSTRAA